MKRSPVLRLAVASRHAASAGPRTEDVYPALVQVFMRYADEEYAPADYGGWAALTLAYAVRDEPPEQATAARRELTALLATSSDLTDVVAELGCTYSPLDDGYLTVRDWLERARRILAAEETYPALAGVFTAYLHEHRSAEYDTVDASLYAAVRWQPREQIVDASRELTALLATSGDLAEIAFELGANYRPQADGYGSVREWLEHVQEILPSA